MHDISITAAIDAAPADPAIVNASERVARAEDALAEQQRVTQQARDAAGQIAARMSDLDQQRAGIAARRKNGDCRDSDAGEVGVIDMDLAGLAELKTEADALLGTRIGEENAARRMLGEAKAGLDYAENAVAFAALNRHADALLYLLTETMAQASEAAGGLEAHAPLAALARRADRIGAVLGDAIGQLGQAGRRVGPTDLRWVPGRDLMDLLRETAIRGRPR